MKKKQKSIGGILYFEWLILIIDYFKSIELKERVFDGVYEEKSVNKNFYDNSWLVSI